MQFHKNLVIRRKLMSRFENENNSDNFKQEESSSFFEIIRFNNTCNFF